MFGIFFYNLAPGSYSPEKAKLHTTPAFTIAGKTSHDVVDCTPGEFKALINET